VKGRIDVTRYRQIDHEEWPVVMESIGVYWIPVFQLLEQRGFEVKLVNAVHVKN
jgi:transposase